MSSNTWVIGLLEFTDSHKRGGMSCLVLHSPSSGYYSKRKRNSSQAVILEPLLIEKVVSHGEVVTAWSAAGSHLSSFLPLPLSLPLLLLSSCPWWEARCMETHLSLLDLPCFTMAPRRMLILLTNACGPAGTLLTDSVSRYRTRQSPVDHTNLISKEHCHDFLSTYKGRESIYYNCTKCHLIQRNLTF